MADLEQGGAAERAVIKPPYPLFYIKWYQLLERLARRHWVSWVSAVDCVEFSISHLLGKRCRQAYAKWGIRYTFFSA